MYLMLNSPGRSMALYVALLLGCGIACQDTCMWVDRVPSATVCMSAIADRGGRAVCTVMV
jgi:hypothetical protein